jgi:hypothetical protein
MNRFDLDAKKMQRKIDGSNTNNQFFVTIKDKLNMGSLIVAMIL